MIDEIYYCILAAFVLDLILGDPQWMPHPVRGIGFCAKHLEQLLTRIIGRTYLAGAIFALLIIIGALAISWAIVEICQKWSPLATFIAQTVLLYFAFATRDLDVESRRVYHDLQKEDLATAREDLSMIVGRDTENLNEKEVVRATVETVAENTVDAVVSPLLFACIAGAPGAWLYKTINTLDSMVGHKIHQYRKFGLASAKLDTVANHLPARLTGLIMPFASLLCGYRVYDCVRIMLRSGAKSPSAIPEAAVAGALGVRLGGINYYQGQAQYQPELGDHMRDLDRQDIVRSINIMYVTAFLALAIGLLIRMGLLEGYRWISSLGL